MKAYDFSPVGSDALAFTDSLMDPAELRQSDLRVAFLAELIKARQESNLTQSQLSELSGIKQPMIARVESGKCNPGIDTLLKLLNCMGKTLTISSIK